MANTTKKYVLSLCIPMASVINASQVIEDTVTTDTPGLTVAPNTLGTAAAVAALFPGTFLGNAANFEKVRAYQSQIGTIFVSAVTVPVPVGKELYGSVFIDGTTEVSVDLFRFDAYADAGINAVAERDAIANFAGNLSAMVGY